MTMWTELRIRDGYVRVAPLRLGECGYDLFLSSRGRCLLISADNVVPKHQTFWVPSPYGTEIYPNCRSEASAMNRIVWVPWEQPAPTGPYYGYLFCKVYQDGSIGEPNRLHRVVIGLVGSRTRSMRPIGPVRPRYAPTPYIPIRHERFVASRLISWWSTASLKQEVPRWRTRVH